MTLVVARITDRGPRLIADIRTVVAGQGGPPRFQDGVLKLLVLEANLCVGFAGEVPAALEAVRGVANLGAPRDVDAVIRQLERTARAGRADFIVAQLDRLVRIQAAGNSHLGACGIGAPDAFSRYQQSYHEGGSTRGAVDEITRMSRAFQAVIDDSSVETVGEIKISVGKAAEGFVYAPDIRVSTASQTIPAGEPTLLSFGTAAVGAYATSVFTPSASPSVPLVGVHFFHGGFGYVYSPLDSEEPFLIRGDQDEFANEVRTRFGVDVHGCTIS